MPLRLQLLRHGNDASVEVNLDSALLCFSQQHHHVCWPVSKYVELGVGVRGIIRIFHISTLASKQKGVGFKSPLVQGPGFPLLPRLPPTVQRSTLLVFHWSGGHRWTVHVSTGFYMEWIKKECFPFPGTLKNKQLFHVTGTLPDEEAPTMAPPHGSSHSSARGQEERDEKDQWVKYNEY